MTEKTNIEIVDESRVDTLLDVEIRLLLCDCFPEWAPIFREKRLWHNTPPIFSVLGFEETPSRDTAAAGMSGGPDGLKIGAPGEHRNRKLIGHIAVVVRSITTTWNWRYNVASIQGVSVLPSRRHEKLGVRMLEAALEETRQRGFLYAILFCKEPLVPYYEAMGWRLADDSMVMWNNRDLPIAMRSNCPMYLELTSAVFPEGPLDVHSPSW